MRASDPLRTLLACVLFTLLAGWAATPPAEAQTVREGTPLAFGHAVEGVFRDTTPTYGGRGRFHLFRFPATEGQRFVIDFQSPNFDAFLVVGHRHQGLFDPLAVDDDGGEGTNALMRFIAPRAGTYLVVAQALTEDAVGLYTLRVDTLPAPGPVIATALHTDEAVEGELSFEDPVLPGEGTGSGYDLYALDVESGGRYMIAAVSEEFDAVLDVGALGDEDLAEVTWTDDDGGYGTNPTLTFTAPATGRYGVRVRSFGAGLGAYTLRVARLDTREAPEPVALALGEAVAGELGFTDGILENGGFFDLYTIEGREGELVRVSLDSEAFDPFLSIGTPGGEAGFETITTDDDGGEGTNSMIELVLPRDGEYLIRVESLTGGQTGPYRLEARREGEEG